MKPDELRPTRAGLADDDGRSAYQPGKRRGKRRWNASIPTLWAETNTRLDQKRERDNEWRRKRRTEQDYRARELAQSRARTMAARADADAKRCGRCGRQINARWYSGLCAGCGISRAQRLRQQPRIDRELRTEVRTPNHDRNVSRLHQEQQRLPL